VDPDIDQVGAEMEGFKSGNRKQYIRPEVVYLRPPLKYIYIYSLDIFVNYFRIQ
jgi:hypothetical protein